MNDFSGSFKTCNILGYKSLAAAVGDFRFRKQFYYSIINQSRGCSFNVVFYRIKKGNFITAVFKIRMVNLTAFGGFPYDIYPQRLRQTTAYLNLDKLSVV